MISREEILAFVEEVARIFRPARVILFGSYAYGRPTEDSDVDLMVVMRHRGLYVTLNEMKSLDAAKRIWLGTVGILREYASG